MRDDVERYLLDCARESQDKRYLRKELAWRDIQSRFDQLGISEYFRVERLDDEDRPHVLVDITIDSGLKVRYDELHGKFLMYKQKDGRGHENPRAEVCESWAEVCEELVRRRGLVYP